MRRVKPYNKGDEERAQKALKLLRQARDIYKKLDAPKALEKVRLAIRSGDGVVRNIDYRWINSAQKELK